MRKKLDRQGVDKLKPRFVLDDEGANRGCSIAAHAITVSVGDFAEATLLFLFGLTGEWVEQRKC